MSKLISVIYCNIKVIKEDYGFRLIVGSSIDKFPFNILNETEITKFFHPTSLGIIYEIKIFNLDEALVQGCLQDWIIDLSDSNDNWNGKWLTVPSKDGWIKMENI